MENGLTSRNSAGQKGGLFASHRTLKLSIALVALLIILSSLIIGSFWYYDDSVRALFNFHYQSALNLHKSRDYTGAIQGFTNAIDNAPDPSAAGQTREMIAFDTFQRNQGNDRAQAVQMYKSLITDPAIPAAVRAIALTDLGLLTINQGNDFAREYFSAEPFDWYVSDNSRFSVYKTGINMFEAADAIAPESLAEYAIGYNYSTLIVNGALGTTTPQAAAETIQQYIQKGDQNSKSSSIQYSPSNIAREYFFRAIAMGVSGNILNNISLPDREEAFQLAISQEATTTDPQVEAVLMQARLNYGIFLYKYDSGTNANENIENVLKPFAQAATSSPLYAATRASFVGLITVPADSSFIKQQSLKLATISPDFKDFLLSVGWKL